MEEFAAQIVGGATNEGLSSSAMEAAEIGGAMEVLLTRVDLDLAYSSEKLMNLDKLLIHVLASENDLEAMALENEDISSNIMQRALFFDLLSCILDYEVRELSDFIDALQGSVIDAREKISTFEHLRDLFFPMEDKLHDSEESLKQSQDQVVGIKMQSAKLQKTLLAFKHNDWKYYRSMIVSGNEVANVDEKPRMQTIEQQRHILRMLEKSIARELDLEKKLTELKQNEEDLKLKRRLTEQVVLFMEEAAEVVWGRFLEAENAREVLMGISKELVGRLQITRFNLNSTIQREENAKSKLHDFMEQLEGKETALLKLESHNAELIADNSEVSALREKVKLLEEQLRESESQLKKANASNEENQEQLRDMENMIDSLKENIDIVESRAENTESKVAQLTETNAELIEEVNFLKGANDSNAKKVSLLEKQLRGLEIQLQHAKASSEASQEQQNMLYSAIWDMETLIEELKSKVSKAEIKTDNAEEQCVILSETNLQLNDELTFLRTKVERLETSLEQANDAKIAAAKDVNLRTKLIMDMVTQLALERKRIHKQLSSSAAANKILVEKLRKSGGVIPTELHDIGKTDEKEIPSLNHDLSNVTGGETPEDAATKSSSDKVQVDETGSDAPVFKDEMGPSSSSANGPTDVALNLEAERAVVVGQQGSPNQVYVFMAILMLLLSMLATYLVHKKSFPFDVEVQPFWH